MDPLLTHDQRFFTALTSADTTTLDALLHPDFLLVAVDSGAVVPKRELIDAVESGAVTFPAIETFPAESHVRRVGDVGIVVGRTTMSFTGFSAASRYTHVFTERPDGTRLLSAQGTPMS